MLLSWWESSVTSSTAESTETKHRDSRSAISLLRIDLRPWTSETWSIVLSQHGTSWQLINVSMRYRFWFRVIVNSLPILCKTCFLMVVPLNMYVNSRSHFASMRWCWKNVIRKFKQLICLPCYHIPAYKQRGNFNDAYTSSADFWSKSDHVHCQQLIGVTMINIRMSLKTYISFIASQDFRS